IIATPIGNLEDITFRAVRILGEVDLILCEDTRVTKKLLQKYEIKTPTMSYHQHSKISKMDKIFELIREGKDIALVSDAGTPSISDPGSFLVSKIREEFGNEIKIIPIPGASALISALSASGLTADQFLFLGFLPHKKGRETLFKEIAETKRTVAFYESPHRIIKTLNSLKEHLEAQLPNRKIVVARELTKIFEEIVSGSASEILEFFEKNPDKIRGEFVVMVDR
ncbi:16S rRNA (cytidine(1402)-2'-O)-methyltransferase, partial [Candidatus Parcubacteria bacterium]|nr:16S rRNA (cytidine(1402)-2'-O)-methyltransferase [Candidatus Parcubacteria bacterium]